MHVEEQQRLGIPNTTRGRRMIRHLTPPRYAFMGPGTYNIGANQTKRDGDIISHNRKEKKYQRTISRRFTDRNR